MVRPPRKARPFVFCFLNYYNCTTGYLYAAHRLLDLMVSYQNTASRVIVIVVVYNTDLAAGTQSPAKYHKGSRQEQRADTQSRASSSCSVRIICSDLPE